MKKVGLAKPEVKIVITDPDLKIYSHEEWIITEEPLCGRFFGPYGDDIIWVGPESGPNWPDSKTRIFLYPHQYERINKG